MEIGMVTFGNIGIGEVIYLLKKDGHAKARRKGWNAKGQFISLQMPDAHSKMKKPYLYISPVDGELVPWLASQTDLLTEDWIVEVSL
jgi:hypothetical protein